MTETRERLKPQERTRRQGFLGYVGRTLYGASWQTPMAEALTATAGREIPRTRVNQWATGAKPVPIWAMRALIRIAHDGADRMHAEADRLEEEIRREAQEDTT